MASIYLLRHADAVTKSAGGRGHDRERPLSDAGRDRMDRAARGMKRLGLIFDRILTSPYVRARQTAEIVAGVLGAADRLVVENALASGARWEGVRDALHAWSGIESVLLVGHEPDLSGVTAELIGARREAVSFGKGTLGCVAADGIPPREAGVLIFLLTPEILATLGA